MHFNYGLFQIKNGVDKSFGSPEIVTFPGEEATVEVGGKNNLPEYKLSVVFEEVPK